MIQKIHKKVFLCIAACLVLVGCNFPVSKNEATKTAEAGGSSSVLETAKAIVNANLTATAAAVSGKPTTPPLVKPTTAPVTIPTVAVAQPTTKVVSGSDAATLAAETVPDDTKFLPGATITKTWRIMNSGSSTWSTDYKLVFADGDQMGANNEYRFNVPVEPGKIIDITIQMKAPDTAGTYKGYWKIKNPNGTLFGPGGNGSFWVKIISAAPTATVTTAATATATTAPATATPQPAASSTPG
jgi:hypothetical protein